MGIGTSVLLIAVGAILRYAITVHASGVNIQVIGLILMLVGIVGLLASLLWATMYSERRRIVARDRRDY